MKKILTIIVTIVMSVCVLTGCGPSSYIEYGDPKDSKSEPDEMDYSFVASEASEIEFEQFDNGLMSMMIPSGWEVIVHPNADLVHYTFEVVNPDNRNYLIYFGMKAEGSLASENEREWYASLYPRSPYSIYPAVDPQNTEGFYRIFSQANMIGGETVGDFVFPRINDFYVMDYLGTTVTGGDIVRASFKNIDNEEMEGIFTASPKLVSLYYVNAVNVYNIIFFTAPKDELINWVDILNYCVGTITFSDDFTNAFYGMQDSILQSAAAISQINAQTSAIITEGWANRQTSYDIISQKQSDATLGFDRVLDENTGDIYRAYNGFLDEYGDDGFVAVSDDMYLLPVSGDIVK
ncbi:MAG: hypothetical protein ACI4WM_02375 [Erysipelotrichaceae bacterium]